MFIPAAAVPRVVELLQARGDAVQVVDSRPWEQNAVVNAVARDAGPKEIAFHILASHHSALVKVTPPRAVGDFVSAFTASAAPRKVLVAVSTCSQRDSWSDRLAAMMDERVATLTTKRYETRKRIMVATFETASRTHPEIVDLVIVPVAAQSLSERFAEVHRPMLDARFFALSTANQRFDELERLRLEMMFGQEIVVSTAPSPPTVQILPIDITEITSRSDSSAWKKNAIWANGPRNRAVAAIASAIVSGSGDCPILRRHDVGRADQRLTFQSVVVLTENSEHAGRLSLHLEGWPVIDRHVARDWGALSNVAQQAHAARSGVIMTQSVLEIVMHRFADVILRADAGVGELKFSRIAHPRLVIDLDDVCGRQFAERSRRRHAAYRAAGWLIAGDRTSSNLCREGVHDAR